MKVLVLGGSYFVGAAIATRLLEEGCAVTIANRGTRPPPHAEIRHVVFDRTAPEVVRLPRADVVVDTSGYTPADAHAGLAALAELPDRYVFVSSAAVYRDAVEGKPVDESSPAVGDPIWGEYGKDKAQAEGVLSAALGDRLVILRPPYIYGPHNNLERESFLWDRLLAGRAILIPGDGGRLIQFVHVDDLSAVVSALARAAVSGVFNVGEPRAYSIREYIETIGRACGRPVRTIQVPPDVPARSYFPFRDAQLFLDCTRVQAYAPEFRPLAAGLASTFTWYANEQRPPISLTDLEQSYDAAAV